MLRKEKMYHCVYRITHLLDWRVYIGKHSGKLPSVLDIGVNYFSSSTDKDFVVSQKEKPENYNYEILRNFETSEAAIEFEIYLHNKHNVGVNAKFYNKVKQTSVGFDNTGMIHSTETRVVLKEASIRGNAEIKADPIRWKERSDKRSKSMVLMNKRFSDDPELYMERSLNQSISQTKANAKFKEDNPKRYEEIKLEASKRSQDWWDDKEFGEERRLKRSSDTKEMNDRIASDPELYETRGKKISLSNIEWWKNLRGDKKAFKDYCQNCSDDVARGSDNVNAIPVIRFDPKTGEALEYFGSLVEAAASVGKLSGSISNAINGRNPTLYGSAWRRGDTTDTADDIIESCLNAKPILQINPTTGSIIKEWEKVSLAADYTPKGNAGNIRAAARPNNNNLTSGGFAWRDTDTTDTPEEIILSCIPKTNVKSILEINLKGEVVNFWKHAEHAGEYLDLTADAVRTRARKKTRLLYEKNATYKQLKQLKQLKENND